MAVFPMCPACQAEYDDPLNRRFHAQPNACWTCGPRVWLAGADGSEVASPDPIALCIQNLLAGQIMAIKGIGGFHLAVDATNEEAIARLRQRKHRYGKPLAVMVRDLDAARELCELTDAETDLLQTSARPIVLARARAGNGIASSVAPGIPWLGIYLPYAPLQYLLFADARVRALVMTSANLSEEPIAINNDEARTRLGRIADAFLMHNRDILQRCDDSVAAIVDGAPQLLRRARGYVPLGIDLPFEAPPLLAVGGHLKNVFALARGRFVYQSQHLGDLENLTGLDFFTESQAHLMRTFEIEPQTVVHDLHPGYLSTSWAKQWAAERNLPTIAVQHHHAHIAACMAEHAIEGPVIGLSLDGTGYGTDGRIWGGEVLIAHLDRFERWAHLDYVPMPGGDAAVREPWRMAFSHLLAAGFSENEARELTGASEREANLLSRMIERKLNSPLTSSLGRLFDAAAAVILKRGVVDYEAQAAIELEGCAVDEDDDVGRREYTLELWEGGKPDGPNVMRTDRMWKTLLSDLRCGEDPEAASPPAFTPEWRRDLSMPPPTHGLRQGSTALPCPADASTIAGLARLLRTGLEEEGFQVFQHRKVSPGDGGTQLRPSRRSRRNSQSSDAADLLAR